MGKIGNPYYFVNYYQIHKHVLMLNNAKIKYMFYMCLPNEFIDFRSDLLKHYTMTLTDSKPTFN